MTEHDAERQENIQRILASPAYRMAYEDIDFFKRDELRPIRLQMELLKPELIQQDENIRSTIVVFGSARTRSPDDAADSLSAAREVVARDPDNADAKLQLELAERDVRMADYYAGAREFSRIVSSTCQVDGKCDYVIVTGGGPGIMEAANRGAYDVGAKSIGLNISLPFEQSPNPYVTPELCFNFRYFALRKMHFLMRAKALVAFPGGFGTLDELFNTLTLIQTGKMQNVPIILYCRKFWDSVIHFDALVEAGTISPKDLHLFQYAETAQEAWDLIAAFDAG
ncbi:MAG: TIGR00730 family Rossman fold protein [Verrucomicrobia bacterium]|nr:TIGR00730 family Rossman fold protein [Verrucomicrobiota bacterium]